MSDSNIILLRWLGSSLVLIALGIAPVAAQTGQQPTDEELRKDLRSVIVLAGYPCRSVVEFTSPDQSVYHVSCEADRMYRVHVSEEKHVVVESRSDPAGAASKADSDHEAFMHRQLFAIVNLAGKECTRVLHYERQGPRDSIVTCEDQSVYRVHVTPEGRVAVDEHPIEK